MTQFRQIKKVTTRTHIESMNSIILTYYIRHKQKNILLFYDFVGHFNWMYLSLQRFLNNMFFGFMMDESINGFYWAKMLLHHNIHGSVIVRLYLHTDFCLRHYASQYIKQFRLSGELSSTQKTKKNWNWSHFIIV